MPLLSLWITGKTRSGKTARLIEQMNSWGQAQSLRSVPHPLQSEPVEKQQLLDLGLQNSTLVFAANSDNRLKLVDQISGTTQGQSVFRSTTPFAFFEDEVLLFWPLLVEALGLTARLPMRLRPEMEQELATRLWSPELESGQLSRAGVNPDRMVRQGLDIFQLAALSGTPLAQISETLERGFSTLESSGFYSLLTQVLLRWRSWCLDQGFLTYGLIAELYGQHLLHQSVYQDHLIRRYSMVLADDVDEYPAIARSVFELFLSRGTRIAFTYNPDGAVRLGLGADPQYLEALQWHCQSEVFLDSQSGFAPALAEPITELVLSASPGFVDLSMATGDICSIQTVSRANLLRRIAAEVVSGIKSGQVNPEDIAVIGPGLDAIARYTLRQILTYEGIAVESVNEQRPLASSPMIRALLTVLTLVYPGLGRLVDRDAVAEMLVVLSQRSEIRDQPFTPQELHPPGWEQDSGTNVRSIVSVPPTPAQSAIDPVRAGLLTDHCFVPDLDHPYLLPVNAFPRWDRLGYQTTEAYQQIRQWLETQRSQQQQRLLPNPVSLLDRVIQRFFVNGQSLGSDQLAALRELIETAVHYWDVESRLHQSSVPESSPETVRQFIQLLRRGIVTANPYPVSPLNPPESAVTLATLFQYRANRRSHRWQFWLDVGSVLWLSGGASDLWGASLFLQGHLGQPWTIEDQTAADLQRLRRVLLDLLGRVSDRLYLCHSDLAVSGQEQLGPLLPLVYSCGHSI